MNEAPKDRMTKILEAFVLEMQDAGIIGSADGVIAFMAECSYVGEPWHPLLSAIVNKSGTSAGELHSDQTKCLEWLASEFNIKFEPGANLKEFPEGLLRKTTGMELNGLLDKAIDKVNGKNSILEKYVAGTKPLGNRESRYRVI